VTGILPVDAGSVNNENLCENLCENIVSGKVRDISEICFEKYFGIKCSYLCNFTLLKILLRNASYKIQGTIVLPHCGIHQSEIRKRIDHLKS
jgi:hypothetical protein